MDDGLDSRRQSDKDSGVPRRRTRPLMPEPGVMTFYLSNSDVRPVGFEPAEFIEPPTTEMVATITPRANGPQADGISGFAQWLLRCGCGRSATKPNCDSEKDLDMNIRAKETR